MPRLTVWTGIYIILVQLTQKEIDMELEDWTLEIHKRDRRTKLGSKLVGKYEYSQRHLLWMQEEIRDLQSGLYPPGKYRIELIKTWVERRNAMTGQLFRERYDTPWHCSPSSETYWSM